MQECPVRAAMLLGDAAARGSALACYQLGENYSGGHLGFPKDYKMARRSLSMVASASIDDLKDEGKERAVKWLREHEHPAV